MSTDDPPTREELESRIDGLEESNEELRNRIDDFEEELPYKVSALLINQLQDERTQRENPTEQSGEEPLFESGGTTINRPNDNVAWIFILVALLLAIVLASVVYGIPDIIKEIIHQYLLWL